MTGRAWEVLACGPQALVQDLGRAGLAHLGVGRSGAADRGAHRLGQRLLGNDEGAASIEVTFGGLVVRVSGDCLVSVTGAAAPVLVDGRHIGHAAPVWVGHGCEISVGIPEWGLRTYLSVRGGLAVAEVLGSRSSDVLSGVGPAPLSVGDALPIGPATGPFPQVDVAATARPRDVVTLHVAPGPRLDWLADPEALVGEWVVSDRSDRVGLRLQGPSLQRHPDLVGVELPSEGVVRGSLQIPTGGEPVLFLADHPVTGGYPVAAVVLDADTDLAAQLAPGHPVRLRWAKR